MLLILGMPALPQHVSSRVCLMNTTASDVLREGSLGAAVFEYFIEQDPKARLTAEDIVEMFDLDARSVYNALRFAIEQGFIRCETASVHDGIGRVRRKVYTLGERR